jgi:hypothetical protein
MFSKTEIMRCLKRYVARELYPLSKPPPSRPPSSRDTPTRASPTLDIQRRIT